MGSQSVSENRAVIMRTFIGFVLCLGSGLTQDSDPLDALAQNIPGAPGQDYPIFAFPPDTALACDGKIEGYYADPEADCQAFHICANDSTDGKIKYSFLCPNGTLFNQQYFICDWWFNVDCSQAEDFYSLNADVKAAGEAATEAREGRILEGVEERASKRSQG